MMKKVKSDRSEVTADEPWNGSGTEKERQNSSGIEKEWQWNNRRKA